jgi:hypothetical protein
MGSHGLCDIAGEVLIDRRRRIFWQEGDALGDGSTRRSGRVQHGYGQRTIFDDNLSSRAHVGEQRSESRAASAAEMWIVAICVMILLFPSLSG